MTADIESVLVLLEARGIKTGDFKDVHGKTPEERLAAWFADQIESQGRCILDLSARVLLRG